MLRSECPERTNHNRKRDHPHRTIVLPVHHYRSIRQCLDRSQNTEQSYLGRAIFNGKSFYCLGTKIISCGNDIAIDKD